MPVAESRIALSAVTAPDPRVIWEPCEEIDALRHP
jgi:hypothetical protein